MMKKRHKNYLKIGKMIESFKIKIADEREHKIVQETLFSNGAKWREGQETVLFGPNPNINWNGLEYNSVTKKIGGFTDITSTSSFNRHDKNEISFADFCSKYVTDSIHSEKNKYVLFVQYCMNHLNDEKTFEELYDEYILNLKNDK